MQPKVKEAWVYPPGWVLYFDDGGAVSDITPRPASPTLSTTSVRPVCSFTSPKGRPRVIRSAMSVTKRTPRAAKGMVVAEHPLGAEVGAGILERGGNAVDAAVATAFAMTVVEPFMSTIAGGGTMLMHMAQKGETIALDANVEAPGACTRRCIRSPRASRGLFTWPTVEDANKAVRLGGGARIGGRALPRPRAHGTLDLPDAIPPAIELAEDGFIPDWYLALTMAIDAGDRGVSRDRADVPARRP